MQHKIKVINDPIYGLVNIPSEIIFKIIEHPYFQRLRRIKQLAMSYLVYPSALHTRFNHSIGCMYLMELAINTLKIKGVEITDEEKEATIIAILLHDIGHGPFSHALEGNIIYVDHEEISSILMEKLNKEFDRKLDLVIQIFKNKYIKFFLYELISSQLDMDRIDYLKRDCYFTGVSEGVISSERLIAMLNVFENKLVIEEKAIYSVEKFFIARRIMYWQVYYHKTVLSTKNLLFNILKRAKFLSKENKELSFSPSLNYFLENDITTEKFDDFAQNQFLNLDDNDFNFCIKQWQNSKDEILSTLSKKLMKRDLFKVEISRDKFSKEYINNIKNKVINKYGKKSLEYFYGEKIITNISYDEKKNPIKLLQNNNTIKSISEISDLVGISKLENEVKEKYYIFYPKDL